MQEDVLSAQTSRQMQTQFNRCKQRGIKLGLRSALMNLIVAKFYFPILSEYHFERGIKPFSKSSFKYLEFGQMSTAMGFLTIPSY
jgi:hypothetical protein